MKYRRQKSKRTEAQPYMQIPTDKAKCQKLLQFTVKTFWETAVLYLQSDIAEGFKRAPCSTPSKSCNKDQEELKVMM